MIAEVLRSVSAMVAGFSTGMVATGRLPKEYAWVIFGAWIAYAVSPLLDMRMRRHV